VFLFHKKQYAENIFLAYG